MGLFDIFKGMFGGGQSSRRALNAPGPIAPPSSGRAQPSSQQSPVWQATRAPEPQRPAAPQAKKLNLDAEQFAPISNSEALSQARVARSAGGVSWWWRRDAIPPASDPRTKIIDRLLVTYGLLQADELVRMHEIGDKQLEYAGDSAVVASMARAAVAANEQERKRLKAQKKVEAAERKRRRAEEVAHRRATDIIFLGRGVSKGLAERESNREKLTAAGVPVLSTPAEIAEALGLTIGRLRWLAFHSEACTSLHYVRFTVPKKSGGVRELSAPHRELAKAQRWIFQNILRPLKVHAAAHGFMQGRSVRTNAAPHAGKLRLVNLDLVDFFPTITFPRVRGALVQVGYSPAAATILALLMTEAPRRTVEYAGRIFHVATGPRALPQGACTSPAMSNIITRRMDSRLTGIAQKLGWVYTRYADDLSFSAETTPAAELTGYLLARVRHITQEEGFAVNEKKTRVLKRSAAMTVTGVVVNETPGVNRRERRKLRAILHNAKRTGLESQNRANEADFAARVRGKIAYVQMINPRHAQPLWQALAETEQ